MKSGKWDFKHLPTKALYLTNKKIEKKKENEKKKKKTDQKNQCT